MVSPSPGQRREQHKAPLRVPKGRSRDSDPRPMPLPAGGERHPGGRALHPCTSLENRLKPPGTPWWQAHPGLAEHP